VLRSLLLVVAYAACTLLRLYLDLIVTALLTEEGYQYSVWHKSSIAYRAVDSAAQLGI
jgi:hypothetical protein